MWKLVTSEFYSPNKEGTSNTKTQNIPKVTIFLFCMQGKLAKGITPFLKKKKKAA